MPASASELPRDSARPTPSGDTALAGSAPEEAFDRITRLAVRLLGAPISLLSLIHGGQQWIKSAAGVPHGVAQPRAFPVERSICRQVVATGEPLLVADVDADARVPADAPMRAWGVRAYVGVPLITPAGEAVGALCVADRVPHSWNPTVLDVLRDLAAVAVAELEWRRARAQRERLTASLATAEELFRVVVEQSLVALYVIQDEYFTYVNPRFLQVFGLPADYLAQRRHFLEIVDERDHEMVRENIRRRIEGDVNAMHYRLRGRRADGALIHCEVHGLRTTLRGRPALIGVGIDVTERVRAEREREEAILARDRFYAMMSHELRTPVSAVMLYNDLLLSGVYDPLTDSQRDAVDRSQNSARHLLDLINDLLDLSKLESGRLQTRAEDVDVAELVDGVVSGLAPLALEHGCSLAVRMESRPLPVVADARRVRQILLNLLSNAIKFGHGAPVEIRCAAAAGGIAVDVSDQGPGIPPADLERIFEDFVQLGEPGVGTGLGLPIARRLAELQGGSLRADSAPGGGSTFHLFLPSTAPEVAPSGGFPSFSASVILR